MSKQAAPQETPERKPYAVYKQLPLANQGIQPPAPLFVTRDEALLVRIWNSAASPVVHFTGRLLLPNGDIREIYRRIVPNTDRSVLTTTIGLEDGFLLSCALSADMTTFRGQTWCKVSLARPPQVYQQSAQLLISDYLETGQQIGWPGGLLRSSLDGPGFMRVVAGTDPAAGAELSETVPTNARWKLRGMSANLVASATAANRVVRFQAGDGTSTIIIAASINAHTAGNTQTYVWNPAGAQGQLTNGPSQMALAVEVSLLGGWVLSSSTTNLQVGDDFTAPIMLVEEWIEE